MKLIYRYILARLAGGTLLTLLALLCLYAFFDAIQNVSQLGTGTFTLGTMARYIGLLVPGHAYELMPLAVLIGCLVAMTQLVSNSEYTILRTSGVTMTQLARTLVLFGALFALLTVLLGEFLAPLASQQAERLKLQSTHSMVAQEFRSGIWAKDNNNYINVREMLPDSTLLGIRILSYDGNYRLIHSRYAERGTYNRGTREWTLFNVRDTLLADDRASVALHPTQTWKSVIEPAILNVLLVAPEQMSALNLYSYITHLRGNHQKTERYDIALWGKLFYPLACVSMALVALAFMPRQRRNGQLGLRLFLGICLGVAFHFINRLFGYLGLLHEWNAPMSATLPTVLFLAAGLFMILRQERR
ncbi:LPS export ABC transporter permease LptG [Paludibacterium paludis]|uniref:LPS export ABC transporter permease LptG n=1 Tax=Paludibacterium paludis TaxID=1225769 RepID=A0A918P4G5_9NEIS|nr:LPS export ABC transporter permease LptG [Paludibacterium paludis]GGY19199.1 LPS export ABC transporter permease LptG [Paludibacterium paludis]